MDIESLEAANQSLQADLKLAFKRIGDLQAAMEDEMETDDDDDLISRFEDLFCIQMMWLPWQQFSVVYQELIEMTTSFAYDISFLVLRCLLCFSSVPSFQVLLRLLNIDCSFFPFFLLFTFWQFARHGDKVSEKKEQNVRIRSGFCASPVLCLFKMKMLCCGSKKSSDNIFQSG